MPTDRARRGPCCLPWSPVSLGFYRPCPRRASVLSPSPPAHPHKPALTRDQSAGLGFTIAAFLIWGFTPLYFHALDGLSAVEMLAHRVGWCGVFLLMVLTIGRQWPAALVAFSSRRVLATLFVSAALISVNWGVFVFAIVVDRVVAASLGYFLTPLVSVCLGFVFLGERPSTTQWIAVSLAGAAVASQFVAYGSVPWIALVIAVTFGLYGLIRKTVSAGSAVGLFVECLLLSPFSLAFLLWLDWQGTGAFGTRGADFDLLIAAAGLVTGVPLLLFAAGARRIRLSTVGLIQYIAPSTNLLLAVALFGERFGATELVTFALLWSGLFLYTRDIWRTRNV